jgi:energy-coupling factor transporter ATP-binding protein EcfA2
MKTDLFSKLKRFGIFGASESGKSTLAQKISLLMWRVEKRPTIALDPISKADWGKHAKVFTNEEKFWDYIFKVKNCFVIVDDASVTINRDAELNGVFTTLRHQDHKLMVIGHSAGNLLPQMRDQVQRVFLFLQNADSIKKWETNFPGQDLTPATQLKQYEFYTVANYAAPQKFMLTK